MTRDHESTLLLSSLSVLPAYAQQKVRRITVGAALLRHSAHTSELLVLRRVSGDEYGGIEELPSGEVEDGETIGEALKREVLEETGIKVGPVGSFLFDFVYSSRKGVTAQLNFLARVPSDIDVQIDAREHDSFRWLPVPLIEDSDLSANIKRGLRGALTAALG